MATSFEIFMNMMPNKPSLIPDYHSDSFRLVESLQSVRQLTLETINADFNAYLASNFLNQHKTMPLSLSGFDYAVTRTIASTFSKPPLPYRAHKPRP